MKLEGFSKYEFLENGNILSKTGRILKGKIDNDRNFVHLTSDDGKGYTKTRARWILMAFTDKSEWKDHAHHIDGNHKDDRLCNLQWLNKDEHIKHHFKKIVCVNLENDESIVFENEKDASEKLGIPIQEISRVILEERYQTHNYWFTKINKGLTSPS